MKIYFRRAVVSGREEKMDFRVVVGVERMGRRKFFFIGRKLRERGGGEIQIECVSPHDEDGVSDNI